MLHPNVNVRGVREMSKTLSPDLYERHHTDCAHCGEHAWCSAFEVDGGFYYVCHLCYVLRKAVEEE